MMAKKTNSFPHAVGDRHIALAIVFAMQMWTDHRYSRFLRKNPTCASMDAGWFKVFLGEWSVARTVSKDHRDRVRKHLNQTLPAKLAAGALTAVDVAANEIRAKRWTHQRTNGEWRTPLSLVSKVAFFLQPDTFVPMDQFSKRGVNRLRGTKAEGGEGHRLFKTYESYLAEFNRWFGEYEPQIKLELKSNWVKELARKIHCPATELSQATFRRKVFDSVLMLLGGRWAEE